MKKKLMDSDLTINDFTPEEIELIATALNTFEQKYLINHYFQFEEVADQYLYTRSYFHEKYDILLKFNKYQ